MSLTRAEAGERPLDEIAAFVANMPRGSKVKEWIGGWDAVSAEEEIGRYIVYMQQLQLRQRAGKGPRPKEPVAPVSAREAMLNQRRHAERAAKKAAAMQRMAKVYGGA